MNQKLAASNRSHLAGRHGLWTLLCVQALTGCISLPGSYRIPDLSLPAQYQDAASTGTAPSTSGQTAAPPAEASPSNPPEPAPAETPVDWWSDFGNRELQGLIDRALSNNPDIRIALNRIVQAKARAEQAAAGKYPGLSAPLVIAQQSPGGVTVGTAPAGGVSNVSSNRTSQRTYQASIRADWRLDIWGEQSALAESANFQLWRAVHERENVQRNLTASLATHYVEFLSLNDRLRIAVETEEVLSATLATIEKRVKAGDATLSELEQQRAAIFAIRATIPTLEQQKLDAIGAMAFLLGTVPGKLKLSNDGLDSLTIPSVAPGLPSALLLRRPDVRVAEAQLLAANADVNVARARILPPMDLSAQIGYSGIALSQLFQPQTLFWNVVDNLVVSIFDGGRKRNEQLFSQAVREEMVESYARTVYQAMKEVESALTSVRLAERRLTAQWRSQQGRSPCLGYQHQGLRGGRNRLSELAGNPTQLSPLPGRLPEDPNGIFSGLHQPVPGSGRRVEGRAPCTGRRRSHCRFDPAATAVYRSHAGHPGVRGFASKRGHSLAGGTGRSLSSLDDRRNLA
jgi:multidrug efflux system outer membrane protein